MSDFGIIAEIVTSAMIVLGASFALIGSWGLVRLPTLMERLHGPTKATTLGLGGILIGSVLFFQLDQGRWSTHELLISLFLFITAPIYANMIAKLYLFRLRNNQAKGAPAGRPPRPSTKDDWATHQAPQSGTPASTSEQ